MIAVLPLLPASVVPPRFFRVQFLSVLAVIVIAGLFSTDIANVTFWIALGLTGLFSLAGSIVWHTDEAPFGRTLFYLTLAAMLGAVAIRREFDPLLIDDLLGAAMLGSAISSMLMGHSYLIAPAMSMTPLLRLLGCLTATLALRILSACVGLWWWTRPAQATTLEMETALWLGARWLLGLLAPMVLVWMSWETARIRSTQSATGILYVVTIVVFLGELLSLLLVEKTGLML